MALTQRWLPISARIGSALLGGYAFVWGFTSLVVALNLFVGGDYDEGLTLAYLLAFLVFVVAFLWAFAATSLTRVWLILAGGGTAMTAAAWALAQTLTLQH
jgi:hypothetical protein